MFCLSIALLALNYGKTDAQKITAVNLRCEYMDNPLGINATTPRLSWEISGEGRDIVQTAYRVLVASSREKLDREEGDLWDSKKINSDGTLNIIYRGKRLDSRTDCYWKVMVWSNNNRQGAWSRPANWSEGLLHPADWSARWIGLDTSFAGDEPHAEHTRLSARYFRKSFEADKKVKKAVVYISGLGIYQLYINGEKIGAEELSPDPTQYDKRVFYNTFDVTDHIREGDNVIGTILGNGRFFTMRWGKSGIPRITNFGYPKMLLQLEITYADGRVQKIVSNPSWKVTAHGPVIANNEYDGEEYDANREMPGWDKPGFEDNGWLDAQLTSAPCDKVEAQVNPLIKVMDTLHPKSIVEIAPGKYIFDMGQNMVGWAAIHIPEGKKGDTVKMRFAERLNEDNTLYTANLRGAWATDKYIMKDGRQDWEPHFTYHGFRYVEITGYPGKPALSSLTGKVVYDGLETTGHFETSNPVINEVYHNAYWGIRGNYRGMPTDCPQRDERMGWLGDRAVGSYGESFIFDNNTLYAKWLQDIQDAQREDGSIPDVAPSYWKIYSDNMTWPGAYPIICNMLYHQFGNEEPLVAHYASIKKWLGYMRDKYVKDNIMTKDTYGDWCMPPEKPELIHSQDPSRQTPGDYLATAFYYKMLKLMQHFAALQHKTEDEQYYSRTAGDVAEAFNRKFLNKANDEYADNTATANLFALAYHLAPDSIRTKVFAHVAEKTMQDFNGHVSTGLVGAQQLMRGLTRNGRADIAYRLATNTTYPSWGYMAKEGATTIWELWNGNTANPAMNSGNHVMLLGDLIVWLYEDLAGIKSDEGQAGFKKIVMKPIPVGDLNHVKASYHSVRGMIRSEWRRGDNDFNWSIEVPGNTTAEIYIPSGNRHNITEGGINISERKGIRFIRMDKGYAVYQVGSGSYRFISKNIKP